MSRNNTWSVILAGGEGERVRPLIQKWLGHHKPKQYCTFAGDRSMFQRTLDRADRISSPDRRITVIARSHKSEVDRQLGHRSRGIIIEQPLNRNTAAGIFLPLSFVQDRNPEATVVIYPSDHFIHPEERFIEVVQYAIQAVEEIPEKLIILGARPRSLELEYGWITPGYQPYRLTRAGLRTVESFYEKPDYFLARRAMASGALWNTFIMIGKVGLLWNLGWIHFPDIMGRFEHFTKAIDTPEEKSVLNHIYHNMPSRSFSTDLLTHAQSHLVVLELKDVLWCDWGNAERIVDTLHHIGTEPAFPREISPKYPEATAKESENSAFHCDWALSDQD